MRRMPFPIAGPLEPSLCLQSFSRYSPQDMSTNKHTNQQTNRPTKTRSFAIAYRPRDAKASQRLLKWTWKWQPRLKWPSNVLQGYQKWHQSKASRSIWFEICSRSLTVASRESYRVSMYVKRSEDSEQLQVNGNQINVHGKLEEHAASSLYIAIRRATLYTDGSRWIGLLAFYVKVLAICRWLTERISYRSQASWLLSERAHARHDRTPWASVAGKV